MALQLMCDLCGKPIESLQPARRFKVKERKGISCCDRFWWEEIDVHESCVIKLLTAKREKTESEGELKNENS